jgi:transcriptional antiterminator NusG
MLVEMVLDNETWHLVKNTPKVTGFVGGARNPPPVPESEVMRITQMLRFAIREGGRTVGAGVVANIIE